MNGLSPNSSVICMGESFYDFGRRLAQELANNGSRAGVILKFDAAFGDQRGCITELFRLLQSEKRRSEQARTRFDELEIQVNRGKKTQEEIAALVNRRTEEFRAFTSHHAASQVFAGSLFVLLNSAIFDTATGLGLRRRLNTLAYGRRIGRSPLVQVIRAGGNNFRHYDEWPGSRQAQQSIRTLQMAGVRGPFDRLMCTEILEATDWRRADQAIREVREIVVQMIEDTGGA